MVIEAEGELERIGFDAHFQARLASAPAGVSAARIAVDHGESYVAWTSGGRCKAIVAGRRLAEWREAIDRPQVGDWVAGSYLDSAGTLSIEHVLERRTCLVRKAAGARVVAQVIAANIDLVGVVSALGDGDGDARGRRLINEPRLQRYLAVVAQSGAEPLLIINKRDLSPEPEEIADGLRAKFPGVPIILTSATEPSGVAPLEVYLRPRRTLALVGMSGVGKSTLVNALLGRAAQKVGDVREGDARGRHTTSHRELFMMTGGAMMIDTPGMRELELWEADEVSTFDDVAALTSTCRFSNCRHETEPDCAVRNAVGSGVLSAERWRGYLHQAQKRDERRGPQPRRRR